MISHIETGHSSDCWAVANVEEGVREDPWSWIMVSTWRDRLGRRNGSTTHWYKIVCKDPSCPAVLMVPAADVANAVMLRR